MSYSSSVGRKTISSLGSSEDSTADSLKKLTFTEKHPKLLRSLTVVAYIFCVSLAAIVLSAYYILIWKPKPSADSQNKHNLNTTNFPCHRGVTYIPDSDVEYVHHYKRPHFSSKYTYSILRAMQRPPSSATPGTPAPPPMIIMPHPSRLVSPIFDSSQNTQIHMPPQETLEKPEDKSKSIEPAVEVQHDLPNDNNENSIDVSDHQRQPDSEEKPEISFANLNVSTPVPRETVTTATPQSIILKRLLARRNVNKSR